VKTGESNRTLENCKNQKNQWLPDLTSSFTRPFDHEGLNFE